MRGYFEINFSVTIKDVDKTYTFTKESLCLYDANKYGKYREPTDSTEIYDIFFMLYPILKEINKDNIIITRGWESWHPSDSIPENTYNKEKDDFLTKHYKKQNN